MFLQKFLVAQRAVKENMDAGQGEIAMQMKNILEELKKSKRSFQM